MKLHVREMALDKRHFEFIDVATAQFIVSNTISYKCRILEQSGWVKLQCSWLPVASALVLVIAVALKSVVWQDKSVAIPRIERYGLVDTIVVYFVWWVARRT